MTRAARQARGNQKRKHDLIRRLRNMLSGFEAKTALGAITALLTLCLSYKYYGAEELRDKVYSPLNADLEKIKNAIYQNSTSQLFYGEVLNKLKKSGDFYRIPKSLQSEIEGFYRDEGNYEANISPITELTEREFSTRIEKIRTEKVDREWATATESRLRAQEESKSGTSSITSMTMSHSGRSRGIDMRNPSGPIACIPGGPTWEINDWLSYQDSLAKVDALWTDEDYLYFDDSQDTWYYRITRSDFKGENLTLAAFLEPVRQIVIHDAHFTAIQKDQPGLLQRFAHLKGQIEKRMSDPKRVLDIFD